MNLDHCSATTNNSCHEYWDGGPKKLRDLLKNHSTACKSNWFCRALHLRDAVVEEEDSSPSPSRYNNFEDQAADKPGKRKRRGSISFLMNEASNRQGGVCSEGSE